MRPIALVPLLVLSVCISAAQTGARGADTSSDSPIHADATRALGYTGKGVTIASRPSIVVAVSGRGG